MKKLAFIALALTMSTAALADGYRDHSNPYNRPQYHQHGGGGDARWFIPGMIAGAILYEATRPAPVIVQQQPQVIVQPAPVYVQPAPRLNEYNEPPLQDRAPVYVQPMPQYKERIMWDVTCTCYIKVLVPAQ